MRAEYVKIREAYLRGETKKTRLPLQAARDNRFKIDWSGYTPPKPKLLGTRAFKSYKLAELVPYIDWTPFFQTWELQGQISRASSRTTWWAARPRSCSPTRRRC